MSRERCTRQAAEFFDDGQFLAMLQRRVLFRTESDLGDAPPALHDYLNSEIIPSLQALGFESQIIANPAPNRGPFLIARRIEDSALPTVLTYGHGDVVNGQEAQWREGLLPWQVTIEGDRWYGRGTADNKGQHTINFAGLATAIAARQQEGRGLGFNVTVLLEMGEEAGSPGLHAICETHKDLLRANVLIASDGPRVNAQWPTLFLGSRGVTNFTLSYRARERAYHSGNWGGVLANPGTVISHAVASMIDRHGRITVEKLRPAPLGEALRTALTTVTIGGGEDDPPLSEGWGEPGLTPAERLVGWNTLEVLALGAGNAQRPVNAIPNQAVAHCQLRSVVGTDWKNIAPILREHLDAHGFPEVEIVNVRTSAPTRLNIENPWVNWARNSIEQTSGKPLTLLPNLAGSLPNDAFTEILGVPTLWVPHSYPACAQHAPNEHLLGSVAREGLQIMAGLYWDLGEPGLAPWSSQH